jgi:N-methylhydantoinase A
VTSRTVLVSTDTPTWEERIEETYLELERQTLDAILQEEVNEATVRLDRWVDARYAGQSFELLVPGANWVSRFHDRHEERYGYRRDGSVAEAVTLRVVATAPGPELKLERLVTSSEQAVPDPIQVHVGGRWVEAGRIWRKTLPQGQTLQGPSIVMEYSATTWIPEGWEATLDEWGNLHLSSQ